MTVWRKLSLTLLSVVCLLPCQASALTIMTHFIGGNAPPNAVGGGNLGDIVAAAARIWESAYSDQVTVTLYFGWAPVGDAGTHSLLEQGGVPNREITGVILFDNTGAAQFYLDPTPESNEEFQGRVDQFQDLGAGPVNVARIFTNPSGTAVGQIDLLSVVLHEMGHALGMCAANTTFMLEASRGVLGIRGDIPFSGTIIPLAVNRNGITSHFDALKLAYGSLMAGIGADERRLPSDLDILADALISGWTIRGSESAPPAPSRGLHPHPVGRASALDIIRRK